MKFIGYFRVLIEEEGSGGAFSGDGSAMGDIFFLLSFHLSDPSLVGAVSVTLHQSS